MFCTFLVFMQMLRFFINALNLDFCIVVRELHFESPKNVFSSIVLKLDLYFLHRVYVYVSMFCMKAWLIASVG